MSWLRKGNVWKKTDDVQAQRFERELAEAKRQYEEMLQQQQLISQYSQSQSASSSTWPPPQRAIDEIKEAEAKRQYNAVAKAQASAREAQIKLQDLQRAVSSIVLRLKVLDIEALEKDLGPDGTVPLRMALSELRQLVAAYDGMPKTLPNYNWDTTSTQGYSPSPSSSPSALPYSTQTWTSTSSTTGGLGNP